MSNRFSQLDYPQVLRGSYIEDAYALRTGAPIQLEVNVQAGATTGAVTASITFCPGTRNLNLISLVGSSALSTAASATLQFSPSDDDAVWINSSLSQPSATAAASVSSGTQITNLLARRVQLVLNTAPVGGDVTFYIIGS